MKRLSGFSLMEMMTVLLIVSIVAAATAPMINKKMMASRNIEAGAGGGGGCHWELLNNGSIAFNTDNDTKSVVIGTNQVQGENPKLQITTDEEENAPHIIFRRQKENADLALRYRPMTLGLTTGSVSDNSVAIGIATSTNNECSVAIGTRSKEDSQGETLATEAGYNSLAIGLGAQASSNDSIAIGKNIQFKKNDHNQISRLAIGQNIKHIRDDVQSRGSIILSTLEDERNIQPWEKAIVLTTGFDNTANRVYAHYLDNADAQTQSALIFGSSTEEMNNMLVGNRSVTIGYDAWGSGSNSIAIGPYTTAYRDYSTAIGHGARATGDQSLAIGHGAVAEGGYSVAIGCGYKGKWANNKTVFANRTIAKGSNSVAIGRGAIADQDNQIVLGVKNSPDKVSIPKTTVYIPGDLVVDGNVHLGRDSSSCVYSRVRNIANNTDTEAHYSLLAQHPTDGTTIRSGYQKYTEKEVEAFYPSDRRLKNVGKAFTGGLAELKKLDLFHFTYKKDKSNTPHVGLMAQDLQKVFPDAVTKGDDGFLRIRMEDMFYALINAVKELANMFEELKQQEILTLQNDVKVLKKENKQLQKTISDLEKQNNEILKRLAKLEKQK